MSTRSLKKIQTDNTLEIPEEDDQQSDDDIDVTTNGSSSGTKKKQINLNRFDLLNQQSLSESEFKEDDNETEHTSNATNPPPIEQAKKKKKKRKKKSGKQCYRRSSEDYDKDMDDIERTVREVHKLFGSEYNDYPAQKKPLADKCITKNLLNVQHKNLNPSYEMKRMFGSKVVQAEQGKRRNQRGGRPMKSIWLVTPRDTWPPMKKIGVFMIQEKSTGTTSATTTTNDSKTIDKTTPSTSSSSVSPSMSASPSNIVWFKYQHSHSYQQIQEKFLSAVQSVDSDNIIEIINEQPYHIDSLIQLSEICKMSEDHAMASELIEHALYVLEFGFNSMFNLTNGNCRLNYRREENRALFITLFKHSQYLEARACCRTALEIVKLILSFDPDTDPLAIILILDYYALRAKQFKWFIEFYNEWQPAKNLSQLPNIAYSYAIALFYVSCSNDGDGNTVDVADDALQYALLMFPGVLKLLLSELSVQVDSRVNNHSFFNTAYVNHQPALQQLISLYVCRASSIWKDTKILPWLERNVNKVLDRVDGKDPIIKEYATKRSRRYVTPPREILRHIILSDFKEKVPLSQFIGKETGPILMYDPLPPIDSINIYKRINVGTANTGSGGGGGGNARDTSLSSLFFQSMFPNAQLQLLQMNGAEAARDANGVDGIDGVAGTGINSVVELRQSLSTIYDAMRDFVSNIRLPERPNDADIDENESTDDEPNDYLT